MLDLPAVNQDAIDSIFAALSSMEIVLEDNPLEFGPRHLNLKTAQARKFLAETESIYLRVSSWIQKYKAAHRVTQDLLELNKKVLYTNDPETRAGRNVADREAIASVKLRTSVEELSHLAAVLDDLGALVSAIKSKRADLKDIQGRIRDQMKLCQEEIGLGSRWGSKPFPGTKAPELNLPPKDRTSLRELERLFSETQNEPLDLSEETKPSDSSVDLSEESESSDPPEEELSPTKEESEDLESSGPDLEDLFPESKKEEKSPPLPKGKSNRIVQILEDVESESTLSGFPLLGYCSVCGNSQYDSPHGPVCSQGHGGAPTLDSPPPKKKSSDKEIDDFLGEVEIPPSREELDIDSILNQFGFD